MPAIPDVLAWVTSSAPDVLAWVTVFLFVGSALVDHWQRRTARTLAVVSWVLFGVFWLSLFPHFAFDQKSAIEGILSLAAFPASLYAAYLLRSGRETLFILSRAVGVMGLIYLPFSSLPLFRQPLIELVTQQTKFLLDTMGYQFEVIQGQTYPYQNTFRYVGPTGHVFRTHVLLACTGLGSISIFGGLIAAVRAPIRRKLRALAVAIPIIYGLNLVRTTFITLAFSKQWFQLFPEATANLVGFEDIYMVSYFYSDRVLAQSVSVVALVVIAWLVVRELPELLVVVEDVLYIFTGDEYDLGGSAAEQSVRTDGR